MYKGLRFVAAISIAAAGVFAFVDSTSPSVSLARCIGVGQTRATQSGWGREYNINANTCNLDTELLADSATVSQVTASEFA